MIGDNETLEQQTQRTRKRRGRPAKVKDDNGLAFDDSDFAVEPDEIDHDLSIDGMRVSRLGGW
jgi:hypothetical protein